MASLSLTFLQSEPMTTQSSTSQSTSSFWQMAGTETIEPGLASAV